MVEVLKVKAGSTANPAITVAIEVDVHTTIATFRSLVLRVRLMHKQYTTAVKSSCS